jgi:uncharacterized protein with GYD domain
MPMRQRIGGYEIVVAVDADQDDFTIRLSLLLAM